jgi:hypothetical protein
MMGWAGLALAGVAGALLYKNSKKDSGAGLNGLGKLPPISYSPQFFDGDHYGYGFPEKKSLLGAIPAPPAPPSLQEKYQAAINEALAWNRFYYVSMFDALTLADVALNEYGDPRLWPAIVDASFPIERSGSELVLPERKDYYTFGEGAQVRVPPVDLMTDELAVAYRARAAAYARGDIDTFRRVTVAF